MALMSVTEIEKTITNVRISLQSKSRLVARTYGIPAIKIQTILEALNTWND